MSLYKQINNFSAELPICYLKASFHCYILLKILFDLSYNFTILKKQSALMKFIYYRMISITLQSF